MKKLMESRIFRVTMMLTLIASLAVSAPKVGASPAIIYVPDDYLTIQAAVDAASPGDTIIIRDGTYTENVNVNKSLTIESESGAETTIVQAADPSDSVFEVMADYVGISGFTVDGASEGGMDGAYLSGGSGIALNSGSGCNISNNIFGNNNLFGIYIHPDSQDSHILENTFEGCGIYLDLPPIEHLASHTIEGNSVNGKPIYYYKDTEGITVPEDAGQVIIVNSSDMVVKNINASSASIGIEVVNTNNSTVENNDCSDNIFGALMYFSSGSTLSNNTVSSSQYGLPTRYNNNIKIEGNVIHDLLYKGPYLEVIGLAVMDSEDIEVENNTIYHLDGSDAESCLGIVAGLNSERIKITGNEVSDIYGSEFQVGILVFNNASDFLIAGNAVYDIGNNGIHLSDSSNSIICNNIVSNNAGTGVCLVDSSDNQIYHNNLIDNTQNASDDTGTNSWDDGFEGNYWSDYEERYPDAGEVDGTGIWDTPYEIPGEAGATDGYPLMEPYLANNPPVAEGLDSIMDKLEVVYGFHDGAWTWYNPAWPAAANTLTTLYRGRGYWINVSEACSLEYGSQVYGLDAGWNLIGWLGW